jgi:hypothetical protein
MGQYYIAIILGEKDLSKQEIIRMYMNSWDYNNGAKLVEHSYINNEYVSTFEHQLTPNGMFYKSRVVWAGDYADEEKDTDKNLYRTIDGQEEKRFLGKIKDTKEFQYILNHSKKQYVDKKDKYIHPLSLLTAEGNERGGGDYYGKDKDLVGTWARDIISVEKERPEEYKELICDFI